MEPRQLDITAARETLVRNQSVWQMNFLRSGDLETFTKEHGLTVTSGQVNLLWKVGLLRADFVISKEPQNIEGLREIVVDGDTRYFLDERIPRATSRGMAEPRTRSQRQYAHSVFSSISVLRHLSHPSRVQFQCDAASGAAFG